MRRCLLVQSHVTRGCRGPELRWPSENIGVINGDESSRSREIYCWLERYHSVKSQKPEGKILPKLARWLQAHQGNCCLFMNKLNKINKLKQNKRKNRDEFPSLPLTQGGLEEEQRLESGVQLCGDAAVHLETHPESS